MYLKILLIFFSIFLLSSNVFAITISPGIIEIETETSVPKNVSVKVLNDTNKDQKLEVKVMNLTFDKNGKKVYTPISKKTKNSIANYIEVTERYSLIKAREIKEVTFILNTPENIVGGNSAIVFFKTTPIVPKNFESAFAVATELGTTILQETKGTSLVKTRISEVVLGIQNKNSPLNFKMKVLNQGNTFLKASATITILGSDDTFKGSFELPKQIIQPQKEAIFEDSFRIKIEKGDYIALVTYKYKDKSISISKPFKI